MPGVLQATLRRFAAEGSNAPQADDAGSRFAQSADMTVEKKTFEMPSYAGETIKSVKIGWEAAGTLNDDKLDGFSQV